MLVLCVGMYRACSTWQYGVVGAILEAHRAGQRLGFVEGIRLTEKFAENPQTSAWAVLKAHDYHETFGGLLAGRRALGIYSYRDLRDAVSSYIHKTGTDLASLREQGFIDLCLNNDHAWRAQPGMLVQNYHDLIAKPARGVAEIAAHLGIALRPGEARAIADALSWETNRRKVESMSARFRDQGVNLVAEDFTKFDPVSLFHWNHIRSTDPSASADASNHSQRATIDQLCRPWLVANGFAMPDDPGSGPGPDPLAPVVRTSYAPEAVDIRLDRLFRGTKGTVYDFDAAHPTLANSSYFLCRRGWRGLNVATTPATSAGSAFETERRGEVHVVCALGEPDHSAATLTRIVSDHRLEPPDLVIVNAATEADQTIAALLATTWRPGVYVVAPAHRRHGARWQASLESAGYRAVPGLAGPALFVRADLADAIPDLARPHGPLDDFIAASPDLVAPPAAPERRLVAAFRQVGAQMWKRLRADPAAAAIPPANLVPSRARVQITPRR